MRHSCETCSGPGTANAFIAGPDQPSHWEQFNRWVVAREKAAVEEWNRSIFPITATHPSGALSVKVHIEDGNCVVATTDAKPIPKPDAGRAEGVKRSSVMDQFTTYRDTVQPAPKPRRAPEVVAEEVVKVWASERSHYHQDYPALKGHIAAAVRDDRGEA